MPPPMSGPMAFALTRGCNPCTPHQPRPCLCVQPVCHPQAPGPAASPCTPMSQQLHTARPLRVGMPRIMFTGTPMPTSSCHHVARQIKQTIRRPRATELQTLAGRHPKDTTATLCRRASPQPCAQHPARRGCQLQTVGLGPPRDITPSNYPQDNGVYTILNCQTLTQFTPAQGMYTASGQGSTRNSNGLESRWRAANTG